MIRDPSDGSVRGTLSPDGKIARDEYLIHRASGEKMELTPLQKRMQSGLPELEKEQDELERLQKSREWLKDWKGRIEK